MTAHWITPQLTDLDNVFDPYYVGNKIVTNIITSNGQDTSNNYAPLIFGNTAPATSIISADNLDLNQLYAAKGTASYLASLQIPALHSVCSGVTINDTLAARCAVIIKPDGTWQSWIYSTNYKTDSPGAYSPNPINRNQVNYTNGRMLASGSWAQRTGNNIGAYYRTYASAPYAPQGAAAPNNWGRPAALDWGTADHYSTSNPALINYLYHNFKGMLADGPYGSTTNPYIIQNTTENPNEDIPDGRRYNITRDIRFSLGLTAQGRNRVSSNFDANGALSWYNRATFIIGIENANASQRIEASVPMYNEIRWNAWNWGGGAGSPPGGGGGGGGGGGCVHHLSWLNDHRQAGYVQAGDSVQGMTDELEFMELPLLSARRGLQPCMRITSESGTTLVVSASTPLTLEDRSCILVRDLKVGTKLPVRNYDHDIQWEPIVKIEDLGLDEVMVINVGGHSYAAGEVPGRYIYTHNMSDQKQ